MISRAIHIFLFHFIMISTIFAKGWIVAESGGNFKKIQDAVNAAVAGDTIFVRAKNKPYFESVTFPKSGNAENGHIVLMNYKNEKPIIDGTGLDLSLDWPNGLIRIINKSYIKVIGFEIRNIVVNSNDLFPSGIWIKGALSNVEILNNKIHTIQQTNSNSGAHGLAVYGTNSTESIKNILIDGNEIYNCKLGWSESLVLNGNVENFVVSNNVIHDNNNIAFDFIGHEGECSNVVLDQARNGLVVNNIAYNIDSRTNPAYGGEGSADGFYVDGGKDIIFERNLVYNCNIGIEIASEHGGKSTSGIIIRNNMIVNNIAIGIAIGGYDTQRGSTNNCKIVNNTLYKNNSENLDWGAELLVQYYCTNNKFFNNIIHANPNIAIIRHSSNTGSNNSFDYNLYYADSNPIWKWKTQDYSSFESFKNQSAQEQHSKFGNPNLIDSTENIYTLSSNSLANNKGINLGDSIIGVFDFLGHQRIVNTRVDIGAVEYQELTSVKSYNNITKKNIQFFNTYPNPFNPSIKIEFKTNKIRGKNALLNIYNSIGQVVYTKKFSIKSNEKYKIRWFADDLSSGIYYAVLKIDKYVQSKKIVYLK